MTEQDAKKFLEYDSIASPLFDGLLLTFSEKDLLKSGNTEIFPGAYLYKATKSFIRQYNTFCKEHNTEGMQIKEPEFEIMVPYCPAFSTAMLTDDIIGAMVYVSDAYGKYEELVTENIVNIEGMSDLVRQLKDCQGLKLLFESYIDVMTAADKIIMLDYSLGAMVIEQKWDDIAVILNEYVDKLNSAHFTKGLEHFSVDDIIGMSKLSGLTIEPTRKEENGKWGLEDTFGQMILPCEWNYIDDFHEGFAVIVDKNNKAGYVNARGEIVIPCIWDMALPFEEGAAVVSNDGHRYGFINQKGKIIIPCVWRFATPFKDGIAKVQDHDGHWYAINPDGETTPLHPYRDKEINDSLKREERQDSKQRKQQIFSGSIFDESSKDDIMPF